MNGIERILSKHCTGIKKTGRQRVRFDIEPKELAKAINYWHKIEILKCKNKMIKSFQKDIAELKKGLKNGKS